MRQPGFDNGGTWTLQDENEARALQRMMRKRGVKTVLELGYGNGGNARLWDAAITDGVIMSVGRGILIEPPKLRSHFYYVTGDTADPSTVYKINYVFKKEVINGADMLSLNGSREGEYPMHDFRQYSLYLHENGVAVFQGINDVRVRRAYDMIGQLHPHREIVNADNPHKDRFGIGVIFMHEAML